MKLFLSMLFAFCLHLALAQEIKLINSSNNEPVLFAHYQYGEVKGVSNDLGIIQISFLKGKGPREFDREWWSGCCFFFG